MPQDLTTARMGNWHTPHIQDLAADLARFVSEGGGLDDCRIEEVQGGLAMDDCDLEVPHLVTVEVCDSDRAFLETMLLIAAERRPWRCRACGLRWESEDEAVRCCAPGGMKWRGAPQHQGALSREEKEAVVRLAHEGCGPRQIATILDFGDAKYQTTTSVHGYYREKLMKEKGWKSGLDFKIYQEKLRTRFGHDR